MDSLDCCRDGGSTRVRLLGTMVGVVEFTHLPSELEIAAWPTFTPERPLELLVSACLGRALWGTWTSYNAPYAHTGRLLHLPNVHVLAFSPRTSHSVRLVLLHSSTAAPDLMSSMAQLES